jgi:hypothetical protein
MIVDEEVGRWGEPEVGRWGKCEKCEEWGKCERWRNTTNY